MDSPAEYGCILDASRRRALVSMFFSLVAGVTHKAPQILFIDNRFTVFLNLDAVIDFLGQNLADVVFQIVFYDSVFRGLRGQV